MEDCAVQCHHRVFIYQILKMLYRVLHPGGVGACRTMGSTWSCPLGRSRQSAGCVPRTAVRGRSSFPCHRLCQWCVHLVTRDPPHLSLSSPLRLAHCPVPAGGDQPGRLQSVRIPDGRVLIGCTVCRSGPGMQVIFSRRPAASIPPIGDGQCSFAPSLTTSAMRVCLILRRSSLNPSLTRPSPPLQVQVRLLRVPQGNHVLVLRMRGAACQHTGQQLPQQRCGFRHCEAAWPLLAFGKNTYCTRGYLGCLSLCLGQESDRHLCLSGRSSPSPPV